MRSESNLEKATNSARNLVTRAEISKVDDALKMQVVQAIGLEDEIISEIEHFQPYGLSSHPLTGSEAMLLFVGADRSHPVAVVVDDRRYRLKNLKQGEVVLYTDEGDYIHLKRGNIIEVSTKKLIVKAEKIMVDAEDVTVNAKKTELESASITLKASEITLDAPIVNVTGKIMATGDISGAGISMKKHVHSGVERGPANTGTPA